MAKEMK